MPNPAPIMKTAILVPTSPKYEFMLPSLIKLLDIHWPKHPEVYIAGSTKSYEGTILIPHSPEADTDWVPIFHAAVVYLKQRGVGRVFVCLDDLHPLGACNESFLEEELPIRMEQLSAGYIYLLGWIDNGTIPVDAAQPNDDLLRMSFEGTYLTSLQVGYWNLDFLIQVTEGVIMRGGRTAWDWEVLGSEVARELRVPCFVLRGGHGSVNQYTLETRVPRRYRNWVTVGPYPFKKGGFSDNGIVGRPQRTIYRALAGDIPEVQQMIRHTLAFRYRLQSMKKWIGWKRKGLNYRIFSLLRSCD
jgi:hypothetical protein